MQQRLIPKTSCPSCPGNAKFVACVDVLVGFNNRIRCFSIYEK